MNRASEEFIALDFDIIPTGGGSASLWDRVAGRSLSCFEHEAIMLRECNRLRTIVEHRKKLLNSGWQEDHEGDLIPMLEKLVADGLMWSPNALLEAPVRSESGRMGITAVTWITMDRPALLERSVNSFLDLEGGRGKDLNCVVVDASATRKNQLEVREALRRASTNRLASAAVMSRPEKDRLVALLASSELDAQVLGFALGLDRDRGDGFGGNLNAALLATAGNAVLCTADDVVFSLVRSADPEGLEISSEALGLMKVSRFASRDSLRESLQNESGSIVGRYERLLGQDVAGLIKGTGQALRLTGIRPELFGAILRQGGRVLIAFAGMWGYRGVHGPRGMLELDTEWLRSHCSSVEEYEEAFSNREILRTPRCPTITGARVMVGPTLGWDSGLLIPPFFPFGQNEDGMQAVTTRACHPDGYVGLVPAAILHDPGGDTRHDPEDRFRIPAIISHFLIDTIRFFETQLTASDPAERMIALGESLQGVADDPSEAFDGWIRELWVSHLATLIRLHDERLEVVGPTAPPYWIADMERFIQRLGDRALDPAFPIPIEVAGSGTPEQALDAFRSAFRLYGRLLTQWPLILEVAADMAAAGEMPLDMISS